MDGAGLIFDFDTTEFGPNLGFVRLVVVEEKIHMFVDVPKLEQLFRSDSTVVRTSSKYKSRYCVAGSFQK